MNSDTKTQSLPNLIADLVGKDGLNIDNPFADLWKKMGVATLLHRAGFHKRSGLDVMQVIPGTRHQSKVLDVEPDHLKTNRYESHTDCCL